MATALTINHIQSNYELAIALSIATTGLQEHHKPIAIALKIFDTKTGAVACDYHSLLKISEEDWARRDPAERGMHQITYEMLSSYGTTLEEVSKQIGCIFKIQRVFERTTCFLSFETKIQARFLGKIIDDYEILYPEATFSQIADREMQPKAALSFQRRLLTQPLYEMGVLAMSPKTYRVKKFVPGFCRMHVVESYPNSRKEYMQHHGVPFEETHYNHAHIVNDIHRVFCKLLGKA